MGNSIVFVDWRVADIDSLVTGMPADAEVVILDGASDGLDQIATRLQGRSGLDAIHIISHGSSGSVSIGSSVIDTAALASHASQLDAIGQSLTESGDILLYGCNVAQGEAGQAFIDSLANATGADVAASTDFTGAALQGGDWILESATGVIEAEVAVEANVQQNYNQLLGVSDYELARMSQLAYSDNPSLNGWIVESYSYFLAPGFFAVEFLKGNDIIIAFRGTDGPLDYPADLAIAGVRDWDAQFSYAIETAHIIREASPDANIYVTGHSLGGSLAQVVSQMFGFPGATFDPGGAANIVASGEFNITASAIGTTPIGVPSDFTNYMVQGSIVSGYSGDPVGNNNVSLENAYVDQFFSEALTGNPLNDAVIAAYKQMALHTIDGIVNLMYALSAHTTSSLQQEVDTWIAKAATGNLGVSNLAPDQGALDFYGTDGSNYLYANNRDNTVYGYAGDDVIYTFEGNDTVYAGDGNDTISTAQGNDVIDAGSGQDTIYAGSGNDIITLVSDNYGYGDVIDAGAGDDHINAVNFGATVDGGSGEDWLTVELTYPGVNDYFSGIGLAAPGGAVLSSGSSWDDIKGLTEQARTLGGWNYYVSTWNGWYQSGSIRNVEHIDVTGGNISDLILYQGGTHYDGGAGTDTFYADFSALTTAVTLDADTGVFSGIAGVSITGMERLLIATGAGDDVVHSTMLDYWFSQHVETGAGNDTIELGASSDYVAAGDGNDIISTGAGQDTIDAGSGNDTITLVSGYGDVINAGAGNDHIAAADYYATVDGGMGEDWLTVELTYPGVNDYFSGIGLAAPGGAVMSSGSSWDDIKGLAEQARTLGGWNYYVSTWNGWYQSGSIRNVEHIDVTGGNISDLILYQGGTHYDGGAGTDTFYADFSALTTAVTLDADTGVFSGIAGVSITGMERLLIATGAGDDVVHSTMLDYWFSQHVETGAGNDTIELGASSDYVAAGDGNDIISTGAGQDTIDAGSGNDTVMLVGGYGDVIDAGAGDDHIATGGNWAIVDGGTGEDWLAVEMSDPGYGIGLAAPGGAVMSSGSSWDDIKGLAEQARTLGGWNYYVSTWNGWYQSGSIRNVEHIDVTGGNISDLILYQGGTHYDGGVGTDTFYADWSALTTAVTLDADTGVFSGIAGVSITGMERLLIATGAGDDVVHSTMLDYWFSQHVETGAGNDTIELGASSDYVAAGDGNDIISTGAGQDTIDAGAGDDTLDGCAGSDTLIGGAGNDIYIVDSTTDVVTEHVDEGTDLVQSSVTLTLAANFENLTLTGTAAINGTGNDLDNVITGNSGNNLLAGGAGNDTLTGAGGNDTVTGGASNDIFMYASAGNGIDTITDFAAGDIIRIAGASFATGAVSTGDGANVTANQLQVISSGGVTRLSIGTDGVPGPEVVLELTGTFRPADFWAGGTDIRLNHAPALTASPVTLASGTEDVAYTANATDLLTGFTDVDGDTLSISALTANHGTAANNGDGTWTITPTANYHGAVYLSYSVTDGSANTPASQSFTLVAVNDPPALTGTPATLPSGAENLAYTVSAASLLAGFTDADDPILSVFALTANHGTVVNNNGTWTITPTANYVGPVGLSYTVSDGHGGNTAASQSFTLSAVNNPPALTGAPATLAPGTEDLTYTVSAADLLAGFTDSDGDTLSVEYLYADYGLGMVTDNGNGTWTITPAADYNGPISLGYSVSDGRGDYAWASQTVTLTAVDDAPTLFVGDSGKLTTAIGGGADGAQGLVLQADGKILVAGYAGNFFSSDFALARYNSDGSLDTSFDTDGKLTTGFGGGYAQGQSVALQPDGKILIAGTANDSLYYGFALARYNTDGGLDTSFDADGRITTSFGAGNALGYSVAVQPDGKILVAGFGSDALTSDFALARYNSDGSLDTSFDADGKLTTDFGASDDYGFSVALQPDGKILIAGTTVNSFGYDFALARYNSDGSLDTSFDTDGKLTTEFGAGFAFGYSVAVQPDGKILVAGTSGIWFAGEIALVRFNADGSLDTSFDGDGKLTTGIGGDAASGQSVTLQSDGKILVAGSGTHGGNSDFALVRFNADGSLDTGFDTDGMVTTALGTGNDYAYGVTVQPDGKILVAGSGSSGSNTHFALVRYNPDGSLDSSFNGDPRYTEGGAAVVLDSVVQIDDSELALSGDFAGASLTLARHGGASAQDVFDFKAIGSLFAVSGNELRAGSLLGPTFATFTNANGLLTINFTSAATTATRALVNDVGQHVTYANTSDSPPATVQIDWTFNDGNTGAQGSGGALAATGSTTVKITNVNDAPTGSVTITGSPGQGQTLSAANTLADADGLGAITYQWQSSSDGTTWNDAGSGATLSLGAALVGQQIEVVASYTDDHGTAEHVASAATAAVLASLTLIGNSGNDLLTGSAGNDILDGGAGADTLMGGGGNDIYYVDNMGDKVIETTTPSGSTDAGGIDTVVSSLVAYALPAFVENGSIVSTGIAKITGNALDNTLYAGTGNNVISGGLGTDTADYSHGQTGTSGVTVSLAIATAQATGGSGSDALISIENLTGSNYNDVLTGNAGANVLSGGAGNDTLDGGLGADTLSGGLGTDIFAFTTALGGANLDTLTDFQAGDMIRLGRGVFASLPNATGLAGDNFHAAAAAVDANDFILYDASSGALYYDADGSGAASSPLQFATIWSSATTHPNLTAADFVVS